MCGVSGFIDYTSSTTLDIQHKISNTMIHRGPDGSDVYSKKEPSFQIGLSHRRLSILELTELGKQPMVYENLVLTFNGEIYNYAEIREELQILGHKFLANSDTEVILHAYKEWGANAIEKFIGMFLIIIYNELDKTLFICRDRAGVKPIYIYKTEQLILFASELKALHEHPNFVKEIDPIVLSQYFQAGYVPEGKCIFKNVYKLLPGHYENIEIETKRSKVTKYWDVLDFYKKSKKSITEQEALSELEIVLASSFSYRMVSDVPVGVFLSGGIDSALVTSILQKSSNKKIKTFTIGFRDENYNEATKATKISQHLGTEHFEKYFTEEEALKMLEILPFHFDEPFADTSALPTLMVSQMASQEVTVALSADAGDEIFAGYNSYDYLHRLTPIFKLPYSLRKLLGKLVPSSNLKLRKLKNLLTNAHSIAHCHKLLNSRLSANTISDLLLNDEVSLPEEDYLQFNEIDHYLEQAMAMDYKDYMAGDILCKVDRAGMAFSLEGREPLLDHRIIEYAAQLPIELKYNRADKKYILKKLLAKYIPQHLVDGPKKGFSIPIDDWLKKDLKYLIDNYLSEIYIEKQQVFNYKAIRNMVIDFQSGKEKGVNLWVVISFQLWYERWMAQDMN